MIILETERLYLREMTVDDAENFYNLNTDPEVIRYTGDKPFVNIEAARIFLENYDQYKKYGFGRWTVNRKSDNEYLGWCGLKYIAEYDEIDIGYRFFRKYWNMGYATESARPCIDLGFTKFKLKVIVGRAAKANIASIRVLEKIGLRYLKSYDFHGQEGVVYIIENNSLR